jgi:hypothetical protein
MLRRLIRSAIVFAAILVAYQAYALVAVPWMEPSLALRPSQRPTRPLGELPIQSPNMYQLLLSNYFPSGHWSQLQPPKVIASANEQAMLVLDDYERHDDGRVDIEKFALLVFPTLPREGITPPHDAIILEAPQGATLQFDDFHPERGRIGQITRGRFPGRITIRSSMRDTRLLYTTRPVRFRMGPNIGSGDELEIRFLADEHVQPQHAGFKFAGIDALEIRRDVGLRLQLEANSLMPWKDRAGGGHGGARKAGARDGTAPRPTPPVEITCNGPFHFDFVRYIASVDRDVVLRQLNPDGPSDQLTCSQLDIHFAPKPVAAGQSGPVTVDPARRQQRDLGQLEPAVIIAEGHPVVISSSARGAEARGDRIQIGLGDRRFAISGDQDVMLVYGPNVIRAPAVEYQHPASAAVSTIGRFKAAGPGSLHYVPDTAKPEQVLQASWERLVELGRDKGQPTLTLDGRPQLALGDMGALTADRIVVYLRELQGSPAAGLGLPISSSTSRDRIQIVPDRLVASGRVEIQSAQLAGRTHELFTTFRPVPIVPSVEPASSPGDAAATGLATPLKLPGARGPTSQRFHIESDRMRFGVRLQNGSADPSSIACEGNVVFREVSAVRPNQQPLEIRGGELTIDQLETGAARITLRGSGRNEPGSSNTSGDGAGGADGVKLPSQQANLIGRGVNVSTEIVQLDQRDNRLWSDRPGRATLLVTRDLNGAVSATPVPIEVSWQGGIAFDGRTVVFSRNVVVSGADDTVHCDQLSARLKSRLQFGQTFDEQAIDLAEVDCRGHVSIDHRSRDDVALVSYERAQLARLTINQQTGEISGDGPGILRSTRFGDSWASFVPQPAIATPAPTVSPQRLSLNAQSGSKLHFLRIDFQQGIGGNLYTRELSFHKRVLAVYGPVDSWEQELDAHRPDELPPESARLMCDDLRVNEDPIAARAATAAPRTDGRPLGPVQLQAAGNVRIDGQSAERRAFWVQGARAGYEQSKDLFVLEGDARVPATFWYAGQQGPPAQARKVSYVRSRNEFKAEAVSVEFTSDDIENARRQGPVRQ